jgi:hypothetical protein
MNLNDFIPSLKYGATASGDLTFANAGGTITLTQGQPFIASASFGSTTLASGVTILADATVTNNRAVYLTGFQITNGATAYTNSSGSILSIQDSTGTALYKIYVTALAANADVYSVGGGSVMAQTALYAGTGATPNKGIQIKMASGAVGAGGICYVTVFGIIK